MSKTENKILSFITVNYNGWEDTCELIESIKRHVSLSYEIIVVDNASRQDEAAMIRERYPDVTVLRSESNLGFAGGNNIGIRAAKGDYLFFINNDTFVEEDTLSFLIERLEADPAIGGVSPKIRFAFGERHIQFAGYTPLSAVTMRNALIGFDTPDDGRYDTPHETPYLHGAAMLIRREAIERAGEMPELFFLYYEELDWSQRLVDAGYTLWYDPRSTVFHKESRSTGQDSPLRVRYITRNRLLFAYRNRRGGGRVVSILYQLLVAAPKNTLSYLLKRSFEQAKAVVEGCLEFLSMKKI